MLFGFPLAQTALLLGTSTSPSLAQSLRLSYVYRPDIEPKACKGVPEPYIHWYLNVWIDGEWENASEEARAQHDGPTERRCARERGGLANAMQAAKGNLEVPARPSIYTGSCGPPSQSQGPASVSQLRRIRNCPCCSS